MSLGSNIKLPNVRKFFQPDPGYILFDVDLAGADAQIVAWEAGDEPLKAAFRAHAAGKGPKVHCVNAQAIFGSAAGPDGKTDPYYSRAKAGVHLTNYGGKAKTCAAALSISVPAAEHFQRTWFELHPAIKEWHTTVENSLRYTRSVRNPFGFVRTYFDRIDDMLLGQALAWVPQSAVAIIIDTAYNRITASLPDVQILLQVHDSLVGQCPIPLWPTRKKQIREALEVVVPYADPLIVPTGLATSTKSWGDVKNEAWDV
jgi:DNA polymerase I-like protein with 3'-5' exonuclease and polymerase domains